MTEALAQNAAAYLHLPVAQILQMGVPGVKAEIRQQFASMVASLRDNQGQPMFKGGLQQILEQFPDPDTDTPRFRSAMATLATTLQQQVADGQAAMEWYKHPSQEGYVQLLQRKAQNAAAAREAFANVGLNADAPEKTAGPPAPPKLTPADAQTVQRARVKLQQAGGDPTVRQRIIDAGKANGVDLEAGGF